MKFTERIIPRLNAVVAFETTRNVISKAQKIFLGPPGVCVVVLNFKTGRKKTKQRTLLQYKLKV